MKLFFSSTKGKVILAFGIAVLTYLIYFLLQTKASTQFARILFPDIANYEIGGIVLVTFSSLILEAIFALLSFVISWIVTRKFISALASLGFFILISICFNLYYGAKFSKTINALKANDQQQMAERKRADAESKATQITITDFKETPEIDSDGYLKRLNLKLTLESNREVTVDNPFYVEFPSVNKKFGFADCYELDNKKFVTKSFNLKKGSNNITNKLDIQLKQPEYIGSDSGKLAVNISFGINSAKTNRYMENVQNVSTAPQTIVCGKVLPEEHRFVFETQVYKLKL